jgi:tRNA-binding EMAP/Myf-like protein
MSIVTNNNKKTNVRSIYNFYKKAVLKFKLIINHSELEFSESQSMISCGASFSESELVSSSLEHSDIISTDESSLAD